MEVNLMHEISVALYRESDSRDDHSDRGDVYRVTHVKSDLCRHVRPGDFIYEDDLEELREQGVRVVVLEIPDEDYYVA